MTLARLRCPVVAAENLGLRGRDGKGGRPPAGDETPASRIRNVGWGREAARGGGARQGGRGRRGEGEALGARQALGQGARGRARGRGLVALGGALRERETREAQEIGTPGRSGAQRDRAGRHEGG